MRPRSTMRPLLLISAVLFATTSTVLMVAEVVSADGAAPIVDAKWELPDMQPLVGGFQYETSPPTDLNVNGIDDADDDPLTTGMQMYPNLCDEPSERDIQYWIVAEDPNGMGDITAAWDKVWEPPLQSGLCLDGSAPVEGKCYKYQVDTSEMACSALGTYDETQPLSITTLSDAMKAAVDTNQITQAAAELLVRRCYKNEVRVFMGTATLAHHQPAGTYAVRANAQDHSANIGILDNTFEVLAIIGLEIDFSQVDWGSIQSGIKDVVSGDENLATPRFPTVKDCGNVDMSITLEYSDMVQQGVPGPKIISSFDAKLLGQNLEFVSDVEQTFAGHLIPCHPKQLDLSIHPPAKLPPGVYAGTLKVTGDNPDGGGSRVSVTVDTLASVASGGGAVPVVDAKWELPDMQAVSGFQYEANPSTDLNANTIPDADDEPLTSGMQMYPWLSDEPEERAVQYWAIAEDETGIEDIVAVWSDVYHPDGTFKYDVDLAPVACSDIGLWDDSVTPAVLQLYPPILAAIDTNQITGMEAEFLVTRCYESEVRVYKGTAVLRQYQPVGLYRVDGQAEDHYANTGVKTNHFEVMPTSAAPVGGIAEMPELAGARLEGSAWDSNRISSLAGVAVCLAAGILALGGATWYARRRQTR